MKMFIRLIALSLFLGTLSPGVQAASRVATFAGGCFWCMQPPFEQLQGVSKVEAGYTGGTGSNPTYQDYAEKGYTEAVQVTYDPTKISYEQLLDVFWHQINPTDPEGQFVDRGPQYRAAIYAHNEQQQKIAKVSREALNKSGRFDKEIVIKILPYSGFAAAEDYHQDFYKKSPEHYNQYRAAAGRDNFLEKIWAKSLVKKAAPTLVPTAKVTPLPKHKIKQKKSSLPVGPKERAYKLPTKDEIKKQLSALQCHAGVAPSR